MSTTIPGIKGRVTPAVRKVTEQYPHAKLYAVDGVASGGPTTDSEKIDKLRVVFVGEPRLRSVIVVNVERSGRARRAERAVRDVDLVRQAQPLPGHDATSRRLRSGHAPRANAGVAIGLRHGGLPAR